MVGVSPTRAARAAWIGCAVVAIFTCTQPTLAQRPGSAVEAATAAAAAAGKSDDASGQTATRKINAYVQLLNDTLHVGSALETYASTVDAKKGPTKARHVEPTAPGASIDRTLAAAEKAAGDAPTFGATDQLALVYVAAYRSAGSVIQRYAAYYNRKDQLADNFKGAAALHVELLPHLAPMITARKNFDAAVEVAKAEIDQRELAAIEARDGKASRWHKKNVLIHSRKAIVQMPNREQPQVDMPRFALALAAFATAVRGYDDHIAANPKDRGATDSIFDGRPASVLGKIREVHDALAKVKGDARRLDMFAGTKIMLAINDYNLMVNLAR